ncbi:class I adenylate-forming enzyme family protein [Enterovirga aerilata]|uniref:Acyl--CoA ligase n=1 Tax=Enterovirga aerilata TaxID=2730920 RepID=A0A849HWF1_9HYPH|nr:class I adenylate-forming enzyme family protein [Enterovirga sp. DB1703]NNM71432.1 acyl--CoA ligase [Enterovirga sp. DB1703]
MLNLSYIFSHHARSRPDHVAIRDDAGSLTYEAAVTRMLGFAAGLAERGVSAGDRIGLSLRDSADHLLMHYAVAWLGGTIVPLDQRWTATEKAAVARAFACRVTLVEDDEATPEPFGGIRIDPSWREAAGRAPPVHIDENLPVVLSLSSGTTGRPTGALVSHRELYERFVGQWVGMTFNGSDRYLLATPLYFGGGRSFAMSFLVAGATVILKPPPVSPEELIATAREAEATVTFLVPTQVGRTIEAWAGEGPAMPSLRRLVVSGAAMPPELRRRALERLSPGLTDYYATSEGGGIAVLQPAEQLEHAATVGRPAFRVEIEVVDAEGSPLPAGAIGRLRYRGPGVSTRLVDAEGAVVPAHPDGWFMPGDLGRITPSGHVQLTGRAKDVIIRGGVNIYPAEIEAALADHPAVLEVAVFAVEHPDLGEELAAAIVLRPGLEVAETELRDHARSRLASYKVPKLFALVTALPRNTSGKVLRAALPRLLAAE